MQAASGVCYDWTGAPAATQSFVLTMYDPDAPTGSGFWHWIVFDIPKTQTSIAGGSGTAGGLTGGAVQATSDYGSVGYGGPCPPAGAPAHRYQFTLYALDVPSLATAAGLSSKSTGAFVGFNMRPHAIAQANFQATYGH